MEDPIENNKQKLYDLDHLSTESWQLELLASGIILLLLLGSSQYNYTLERYMYYYFQGGQLSIISIFLLGVFLSLYISKLFFVLHVLVRGLWIGAIGLRSVSGEISLESLKLNKWFANYLKKYDGGYDTYIHKLEKLASVLFSFNFLLIFYLFSMLLSIGWIAVFSILANRYGDGFNYISIFLGVAMFLSLIDFITFGRLKRGKVGYLFYPFFVVSNTLNLAFLYRSLHYNFIDNKYTRRLIRWLLLAIVAFIIIRGFSLTLSPWLERINDSNEILYDENNYIEEVTNKSEREWDEIKLFKYENNRKLSVFIPFKHTNASHKELFFHCPELEDMGQSKWFNAKMEDGSLMFQQYANAVPREKYKAMLDCYYKSIEVRIDSTKMESMHNFFYTLEGEEVPIGTMSIINIRHLEEGPHAITIDRTRVDNSDYSSRVVIPFYKTVE